MAAPVPLLTVRVITTAARVQEEAGEEGGVPQRPANKLSLQLPNQGSSALSSPEMYLQTSAKVKACWLVAPAGVQPRTGEGIWGSASQAHF